MLAFGVGGIKGLWGGGGKWFVGEGGVLGGRVGGLEGVGVGVFVEV